MNINIGYVQYSPEQHPSLAYAVNVNADGVVVLGGTSGPGDTVAGVTKPRTEYLAQANAARMAAIAAGEADMKVHVTIELESNHE